MTIKFLVQVALDDSTLEALAARSHKPSVDVLAEIIGDVECRLSDAARFRDGVERVGVRLLDDAGATPTKE